MKMSILTETETWQQLQNALGLPAALREQNDGSPVILMLPFYHWIPLVKSSQLENRPDDIAILQSRCLVSFQL